MELTRELGHRQIWSSLTCRPRWSGLTGSVPVLAPGPRSVAGAGRAASEFLSDPEHVARPQGALIGALIRPVSCVSCVASWYSVNSAETHETDYVESGMRYHRTRLKARRTDRRAFVMIGGRQPAAFFTSSAIRASTPAVSFVTAKETGHISPSSRLASGWNSNDA